MKNTVEMKLSVAINLFVVAAAIVVMAIGLRANARSAETIRIEAKDVELCEESVRLHVGESVSLTAKVLPANATDRYIAWYSDNPEVVQVSEEGVVTALTSGKAIVTTVAGGQADMCTITVCD